MGWSGSISIDTDKTDVGSATAVYTDAGYTFVYSARIQMTVAEKNKFVTKAKSALNLQQSLDTKNTSYSTMLTTALNA